MKAAQWRDAQVLGWLEETLQAEVVQLATALGWKHYHTYNSRRSVAGFPDLVLAHDRFGRLLFRELKREGNYPTPAQRAWLKLLGDCGQDTGVWRPSDWASGQIQRELSSRASA